MGKLSEGTDLCKEENPFRLSHGANFSKKARLFYNSELLFDYFISY